MSDVDFDLSGSLKVKSNGAVEFPILVYDFLFNSNHMCISLFRSYSLSKHFLQSLIIIGPNSGPSTPAFYPGEIFFSKSSGFLPGSLC